MPEWFGWLLTISLSMLVGGAISYALLGGATASAEEGTDTDVVPLSECPPGLFTYDNGECDCFLLKVKPTMDNGNSITCHNAYNGVPCIVDGTTEVRPITQDEATEFVEGLW